MKFKQINSEEEIGFQVASMIDIVFLLLIFFIVASQLQDLELEKQVSLPIADYAQTKKKRRRAGNPYQCPVKRCR